MTRCDMRGSECSCQPGTCHQIVIAAPVIVPSGKTQFVVFTLFGLMVAAVVFYISGSMADESFRQQALDNQERVATWKR